MKKTIVIASTNPVKKNAILNALEKLIPDSSINWIQNVITSYSIHYTKLYEY